MGYFSTLRQAFKAPRTASPPQLRTVRLRRGTGAVSAVGEQHHLKTLKKAWKAVEDPDHITVALIPEPNNKHDKNAVRMDVLVNGVAYKAGYISRHEARQYARALRPLTDQGLVGIGDGKIRVDGGGNFQVYVRVSDNPAMLLPPTISDPDGEFIDGTFDLTVTGEEPHQDLLAANAKKAFPLAFALHPTTIEKGTHKGKTTFAVYLDGQAVGQLTRAMTEKHFHVVDSVIRGGKRPYLAGRIEKDHRGYQVILDGPHQRPDL